MIITYHGHSCFKLKGKNGTVVTDPYDSYIGFAAPALSADVITASHQHKDHHAVAQVKPSARRDKPFLIDVLGEYEVGGISVFGTHSYHDDQQGSLRGENYIYTILLDNLRICHLGDLGHELTEEHISDIGQVDVLFVPVGGVFTINPDQAVKVIRSIEPSIVIPMHFKTADHDQNVFGDMRALEDFTKAYGVDTPPVDKLVVEQDRLPEETQLVTLFRT